MKTDCFGKSNGENTSQERSIYAKFNKWTSKGWRHPQERSLVRTKWTVHESKMKTVKIHKCIQYYNLDKQKWSKGISLVEN